MAAAAARQPTPGRPPAHAAREARVAERSAQLAQARADLAAFGHVVSHDLRAPLRHLLGYLGLQLREPELAEATRAQLEAVQAEAEQLSAIIEATLARARHDAAPRPTNPPPRT